MDDQGNTSGTSNSSDTDTLYRLGIVQDINQSVSGILRNRFALVVVAFVFRCLRAYGAIYQHDGVFELTR